PVLPDPRAQILNRAVELQHRGAEAADFMPVGGDRAMQPDKDVRFKFDIVVQENEILARRQRCSEIAGSRKTDIRKHPVEHDTLNVLRQPDGFVARTVVNDDHFNADAQFGFRVLSRMLEEFKYSYVVLVIVIGRNHDRKERPLFPDELYGTLGVHANYPQFASLQVDG